MVALWAAMALGLTRIAPPQAMREEYLISGAERFVLLMLCLLGILRLVWLLWGREEISMQGGLVTVVWRLGYLGCQRTYRTEQLRDLQVSGIGLPQYWRLIGGTLQFRYNGKTDRFADRLNREEATALMKHFRGRLPQSNWTPVLGL
jgi:hypothetical protein